MLSVDTLFVLYTPFDAINNRRRVVGTAAGVVDHLGHIPPRYSPAYDSIVNSIVKNNSDDHDDNTVQYVPTSFTTPATASANRIYRPTHDDINGNPWLTTILWNEEYNSMWPL